MKQENKDKLSLMLFKVWAPVITRVEKMRATILWYRGVKEANKMHKELKIRVYLFYDKKHRVWAPMTWKANKMLKPAYRQLLVMGKISTSKYLRTVQDAVDASFYYTSSKNGAKGCYENNLRTEKLKMWIDYYLYSLSYPMKKLLQFQSKHPDLFAQG